MTTFGFETTGEEVVKTFASLINGKTILITGPSSNSIGAATAIALGHASPATIILVGRSAAKIDPVIASVKALNPSITIHFVQVDLASQVSVRAAAEKINGLVEKIDVVINSAGVMALNEFETTKEGIELQFGANHVGHFLLTNLIIGKLLKAGEGGNARVVNISSLGFELAGVRFDDWNFEEGKVYDPWQAYAQSKTANVLYAVGLAQKLKGKGVQAFSLQPGVVSGSNLAGHVTPDSWANAFKQVSVVTEGKVTEMEPPKTLEQGSATGLVAAFDPSLTESSGAFLQNSAIRPVTQDFASSQESIDKLWTLSEKLVGEKFDF